MKQFSYKQVRCTEAQACDQYYTGMFLSELGDDGWELSGVVKLVEQTSLVIYYFKKERN